MSAEPQMQDPSPYLQPEPAFSETPVPTSPDVSGMEEPGAVGGQARPFPSSTERTWAMVAQLSVLANLFTGFLGPIIALVIYLVYKNQSRYVAYQAMQSFLLQVIAWIGGGILATIAWIVSGLLVVVVIGCCLMPFALLLSALPLIALVYGVIGAIEVNQGKDFKIWLIGDWVRGILTGN